MKFPNKKSHISNNRLYFQDINLSGWTYELESMSPQHHWKFLESDNTNSQISDAGLIPNYLVKNGAVLGNDGKISHSVNFRSGNPDYLKSNYAENETYNKYTFSTWIKIADLHVGLSDKSLNIYNRDNTSIHIYYDYQGRNGQYYIRYSFGGYTTSYEITKYFFSEWTLLTITFDTINNKSKLYVNGEMLQEATPNYNSVTYTTSHYHYIGNDSTPSTADAFETGFLEDMRIYNRTLDIQEIYLLYNNGQGTYQHSINRGFPTSKSPIVHLRCQEISDNKLNDTGTSPEVPLTAGGSSGSNSDNNRYKAYYDLKSGTYYPIVKDTCDAITKTFSLWYLSKNNTSGSYIIEGAGHSTSGIIDLNFTSTNLEFWFSNISSSYTKPSVNKWHHIAIIISDDNAKLYIDSDYVGENNRSSGTGGCPGDLYFLKTNFNGYAQDIRLYDYSLTTTELKNIYNNGYGTLL